MIKWAAVMAVLIVVVVGSIKIFNQYQPTGRNNLLKRAIPKNAAFFIEVQNFKNLSKELEEKKYSAELIKLPLIKKLNDYCSALKSLCVKNNDWQKTLFQNSLIASYHIIGNNNFDIVLLLDFKSFGEPDFQEQLATLKIKAEERNFKGKKIYEVNFNEGNRFSIAFLNNVCIISKTASLTEDAMSQMLGRSSLIDDQSFDDLMRQVPDNFDLSVYINYVNLAGFFIEYGQPEVQDYQYALSSFADWSVFDLKFDENKIDIHGFTSTNEKTNWLQQFDAATSLKNKVGTMIPDVATMVISTSLGVNSAFEKTNSSLQNNSDYRRYIKPWIGNEIDFVLTETVGNNLSPYSFLVFNGVDAKKSFEILGEFAAIKSGGDSSVFMEYKSGSIFQLKAGNVFKTFFPNALISVVNPYCCVYGNSVIMGNSLGQLKIYIDKLNDKSVLSNEIFDQSSFKNSQYSFWINPARAKDFVMALSSNDFKQNFHQYFELIRKCNSIILPFTVKENYYETKGAISFSELKKSLDGCAWKILLDTSAILAPQLMHDADGNKIVFIQDAFYQLYCINKGGEVIWKRKMDSPIMETIYQIDLFSNGEQQYVLNTSGGIYLFDIKGKDVNSFPIRLAAPATSALSMIDFDEHQQFKYFVSCSNGCIYGFEKSGKPLNGWNPNAENGIIKNKMQFYKNGKNEFLTVVDASGKILLFDRSGRRTNNEYKTTLNISTPLMIGKQNQLVAIDSTGNGYELGFDGKFKLFSLVSGGAQFAIMNKGRDTTIEVNLLFEQKLIRMGVDKTKIFTYNFESSDPTELKLLDWESANSNLVLAFDKSSQLLFLINSEGKLVNGFPKKGNLLSALTDLYGNNEAIFLTVQNENELIAYSVDLLTH